MWLSVSVEIKCIYVDCSGLKGPSDSPSRLVVLLVEEHLIVTVDASNFDIFTFQVGGSLSGGAADCYSGW